MIRINLSPAAKRKTAVKSKTTVGKSLPSTSISRGGAIGLVLLLGWVGVGAVCWFLQRSVSQDTERLKAETTKASADAKALTDKIDEEGLSARADRFDRLEAAVASIETKRRSPVYLMHELANILTTGSGPTVDPLEYQKQKARDSQAEFDPGWDATSVWMASVVEEGNGVLVITGGARDPDDLSEFVKRLRASARFERVSHPEYELREQKEAGSSKSEPVPGEINQDFFDFELTAKVRYWD